MLFNSIPFVPIFRIKYLYILYLFIRDLIDYRRVIGSTDMTPLDRINATYPHRYRLARFCLAMVISDIMVSLQRYSLVNRVLLGITGSNQHFQQIYVDILLVILNRVSFNNSVYLHLWERVLRGSVLSLLGVTLLMVGIVYDNYLYFRWANIGIMVNRYVNFWGWYRWIRNYVFLIMICLLFLLGNADSTEYTTLRSSNSYYGQLLRRMNKANYASPDLYFMDNTDPAYSIDSSRVLNRMDWIPSMRLTKSDNPTIMYYITMNMLHSFLADTNCLSYGLTNLNWLYSQSLIDDGHPKLIHPALVPLRYMVWIFRDDRRDCFGEIMKDTMSLREPGTLLKIFRKFFLKENIDIGEWSDLSESIYRNYSDIILGFVLLWRDAMIRALDEWNDYSDKDDVTKADFLLSRKERMILIMRSVPHVFEGREVDDLLNSDPDVPVIVDILPRIEECIDYLEEFIALLDVPLKEWENGNERIIRSVRYSFLQDILPLVPYQGHHDLVMNSRSNLNNPTRYLRRVMGDTRIQGYGLDYPINWSVNNQDGNNLELFQAMYSYPLRLMGRHMVTGGSNSILLFENAETNGRLRQLYINLMDVAALCYGLQRRRYDIRLIEVLNERILDFRDRISVTRPEYEMILKEPRNNTHGKLSYVGTDRLGRIFRVPDINNVNYLHLERTFTLITLHIESFYPRELADKYIELMIDYFTDIFVNSSCKEIRFGSDYEEELWFVSMVNDRELLDKLVSLFESIKEDYHSQYGILREKDLNEWWEFLSGRKPYQESIHKINASLLINGKEANNLHYHSLVPSISNGTYSWWYTYDRFSLLYRLYSTDNFVHESGDANLRDLRCITESLPRFEGKDAVIKDKHFAVKSGKNISGTRAKDKETATINPIDEWFNGNDKRELYGRIISKFEEIGNNRNVCTVLNHELLPELSFPYLIFHESTKGKMSFKSSDIVGGSMNFDLRKVRKFVSRYDLKGVKNGLMQDSIQGLNLDLSFSEKDLDCLGNLKKDFLSIIDDKGNFVRGSSLSRDHDGTINFEFECRDNTCREFIVLCLCLAWVDKYRSRINMNTDRIVPSDISPLNVKLLEYDEGVVPWSHHKFYLEFFVKNKRIPMELRRGDDDEGLGREPEENNRDLYMYRRYTSKDGKLRNLSEVSPLRIHYNYWCNCDFYSQVRNLKKLSRIWNINREEARSEANKQMRRQQISYILENKTNYDIFKSSRKTEIYLENRFDTEFNSHYKSEESDESEESKTSRSFLNPNDLRKSMLASQKGRDSELVLSFYYRRPMQCNPYDTTLDYYLNKLKFYGILSKVSINPTHMLVGIFDRSSNFDSRLPEQDIDMLMTEIHAEIWPNTLTTLFTRLSMMNFLYNQMINPSEYAFDRSEFDRIPSWFDVCPVSILRKVQGNDEGIDYPFLADSIIEHALFHLNARRIRIRRINPNSDSILPKRNDRDYFVDNPVEDILNSYVVRSQHILLQITPDRVGETLLLKFKDMFPLPLSPQGNEEYNALDRKVLRGTHVPALIRPNWYKDNGIAGDNLEITRNRLMEVLRECLPLDDDGSVTVNLSENTITDTDGNSWDLDGVNFEDLRSSFVDVTIDRHRDQYLVEKSKSLDIPMHDHGRVSDFEFTSTYLILGEMKDWEEHYLERRDEVSLIPLILVRSFESRNSNDSMEDEKRE